MSRVNRTQYSYEPQRMDYIPQKDGSAEVYLRKNIEEVDDGEGGTIWEADEVFLKTRLTEEDINGQFDSYFEEPIEMTIEDLAEAVNILAGLILEG